MDTLNHDTEFTDLSALAWVNEELRRSLDSAHKTLHQFLKELESRAGSDVSAVDSSILRSAKVQIHQSVGVLEMLGMPPAATLLRASEAALARCMTQPRQLLNVKAVECIERASFALMDYLSRLLANKPVSPLSFFPQYQAVQEIANADRIHPADLWGVDWSWHDFPAPPGVHARQPDAATRLAMECHMLAIMRKPSEHNFERMSELCLELAAGARSTKSGTLWQLAAAVFEAQAKGFLQSDVYSKRLSSRLLSQLRIFEGGGVDVSERLAQDLLFFCANAAIPDEASQSPRLAAARTAWGVKNVAVDYSRPILGKFDPAVLHQASKRVATAKDVWSAVAGGELHRLAGLGEQFALVADSLTKLYPMGDRLAAEILNAAHASIHAGVAPAPSLAMEVATALLYIEASLEDGDVDSSEQADLMCRLADRIAMVRNGQTSPPLEAWMDSLYRRGSDRQTMGTVVQELRANLSEIEKLADQFYRHQEDVQVLSSVPSLLSSMRGVLSVLGLNQASAAILRMKDDIGAVIAHMSEPQAAEKNAPILDRLGSNLGALDFLIGMLSVQPHMARSLFVFNSESGILTPVMGREVLGPSSHEIGMLPAVESRLIEQAQAIAESAARGDVPVGELSRDLEILSQEARAAEQLNLVATVAKAKIALEQAANEKETAQAREQLSETLGEFFNATSDAVGAEEVAPDFKLDLQQTSAAGEDDEMLGIFLEEAKEVIGDAQRALSALPNDLKDMQLLTTIRRSFHTLKGSSRMVGLGLFGEAAMLCEKTYNDWLSDHKPADDRLISFTDNALQYFDEWLSDIAAHQDGHRTIQQIAEAANSLKSPIVSLDVLIGETKSLESLALPLVASSFEAVEGHEGVAFDFNATPNEIVPQSEENDHKAVQDAAMFLESADPDLAESDHFADSLAVKNIRQSDIQGLNSEIHADHVKVSNLDLLQDVEHGVTPSNQSEAKAEMVECDEQSLSADDLASHPPGGVEAGPNNLSSTVDDSEEGIKVVGDLRISTPLFNIYVYEADELSRRLSAELAKWSQETDQPVSSSAIALAHSLSGASATIGFKALSSLARALEYAQMRSQVAGSGTPEEAVLFSEVAEEISNLLHQFAAGFLKDPDPQLVQRLADHDLASVRRLELLSAYSELDRIALNLNSALGMSQSTAEINLGKPTDLALIKQDLDPVVAEFSPSTSEASMVTAPKVIAFEPVENFPASDLHSSSHTAVRAIEMELEDSTEEDDIKAVDAVDAGLFPIFEEEGQELLPHLAIQIRDWAREPSVSAHGTACMRTLHTLKGGARLAGAMRLGEMAHRLETRIEKLLQQAKVEVDDIEVLNARSDALMHAFEQLRSGDHESHQAAIDRVEALIRSENSLLTDDFQKILPSLTTEENSVQFSEFVKIVPSPEHSGIHDHAASKDSISVEEPLVHSSALSEAVVSADALVPMSLPRNATEVDWSCLVHEHGVGSSPSGLERVSSQAQSSVRVRSNILDRLVNQAGELMISRFRMASDASQLRSSLADLNDNLDRLRQQLRDIHLQAETQMTSRIQAAKATDVVFDPLEFDRFTRIQELTRMMAESVNDLTTVQRNLDKALDKTEDSLALQSRVTRDLQNDLLRTRMVEFDSLSDRLYRVVRQAAKETGKEVRLDVLGGSIEVDRSVLERMTAAFEHLLRNSVTHGIELPDERRLAGKNSTGTVTVAALQEGNEISVTVSDDGAGLDLARIHQKGLDMGLIAPSQNPTEIELANLIFTPRFSTAEEVTELAGRGIGLDVVRAEIQAIGGHIDVTMAPGKGTSFKLQLPLTTAVTQIVMIRAGESTIALPSSTVELVCRVKVEQLHDAYVAGVYSFGEGVLPFFWLGSLLQLSPYSTESTGKTRYILIVKSAQQRIAVHVDEVLGNQEAVVKNLGPQFVHVPGLAGMTLLPSGSVALIYNLVALASLYGNDSREATRSAWYKQAETSSPEFEPVVPQESVFLPPLVLVVDDSLTVRRVTQRLLLREGYRVKLAKDGLDALEKLAEEKPGIVLSDIEMPRMDGFDLVRNIRGDARLRDLPVIMITSRIAQKHRDYAAELGVDHYLGKPYSEDDLLSLIGRHTSAPVII